MEAPLCKACGKRHWERICNVTVGGASPGNVTHNVTLSNPEAELLRLQVKLLQDEVADLKQQLGKAAAGNAERQRQFRARRRVE